MAQAYEKKKTPSKTSIISWKPKKKRLPDQNACVARRLQRVAC